MLCMYSFLSLSFPKIFTLEMFTIPCHYKRGKEESIHQGQLSIKALYDIVDFYRKSINCCPVCDLRVVLLFVYRISDLDWA